MDGTAAIEANRQALTRIVAMLVEMAGLAQPLTSPLMGEVATQSREGVTLRSQPPPDASRRPPHKGEVELRATLPRILWRAILALLRPAESAARRLIIAAAKGLTVPPPRPRQPKPRPQPIEPLLRRLGIAVMMAPANATRDGTSSPAKRIPAFPLFDPPRRLALYGRRRPTVPPHAAPRIVVPGVTEPAPLPPPPSSDDLISATRLTQRLAALAAALD
ncbi:hypothetical protein GRZ55_22890, partial [Chelativorans sp. ZYF759]|uniref:hypothetical protein n=1 Tax=Chelativorans sp. ZYF759 TaxID=2692213 RepID=UPI00145D3510